MSVLRYGLARTWLNTAGQRRLEGFHAQCLRKILRIPYSFYNRISNETVYKRASCMPYSKTLLFHQLVLFGKLAAGPHDALRATLFEHGSVTAAPLPGDRKRGRPRDTWIQKLLGHAGRAAGEAATLNEMLIDNYNPAGWKSIVRKYVASL